MKKIVWLALLLFFSFSIVTLVNAVPVAPNLSRITAIVTDAVVEANYVLYTLRIIQAKRLVGGTRWEKIDQIVVRSPKSLAIGAVIIAELSFRGDERGGYWYIVNDTKIISAFAHGKVRFLAWLCNKEEPRVIPIKEKIR